MLESIPAMSLLTIMEIVGPLLLLAVLIYGTLQWSRRRRGPTQAVREAATRELYREGAEAEKREEAGAALVTERRVALQVEAVAGPLKLQNPAAPSVRRNRIGADEQA